MRVRWRGSATLKWELFAGAARVAKTGAAVGLRAAARSDLRAGVNLNDPQVQGD